MISPFRCPQCGEALREIRRGRSVGARAGIVGVITLAMMTGRLGWRGYLGALLAYPVVVSAIEAGATAVMGHTLEPVSEGGRIPLGESEE
jgi:hypothetical protein